MLKSHDAVYDAVVVGVADERWGQRVAAVVQPVDGAEPTLDELVGALPREPGGVQGAALARLGRPGRAVTGGQGRLPLGQVRRRTRHPLIDLAGKLRAIAREFDQPERAGLGHAVRMRRMSAVDAAFLYGETPAWHMHVSAVMIAESGDRARRLQRRRAEAADRAAPAPRPAVPVAAGGGAVRPRPARMDRGSRLRHRRAHPPHRRARRPAGPSSSAT